MKLNQCKQEFFKLITMLIEKEGYDLVLIDQIMYLLGNITVSSFEYRKLVREYLNLPILINQLIKRATRIPMCFAANFIWVLCNMTSTKDDTVLLTKEDVKVIIGIYNELIKSFSDSSDVEFESFLM